MLSQFASISGLKINIEKSNIVRLGNFDFKWVADSLIYLGMKIPVSGDFDLYDLNFEEKIKETDNVLKVWSNRSLSLVGKIAVIKTLVIPKFVY